MSVVDGSDIRDGYNYRDYTHNINQLCDEATNCSNVSKDFIYHIYANEADPLTSYIT